MPEDSRPYAPRGQRAPDAVLDRPSRADRIEAIERLEARGLGVSEIAEQLGLRPGTVSKYRRDPSGERERANRTRYRGTCQECGRQTDGSAGVNGAPARCAACAPSIRRRWTDDQLLEAIREWTRLTGAAPTIYDWSPASAPAGHPGASRYQTETGRWPHARTVARRLGSMAKAVRHALADS